MGWFLTLFSHSIADNDILFMIWDFLICLQIRTNSDKSYNPINQSITDSDDSRLTSDKYLSLPNNSIDEGSFNSWSSESKVAQGSFCEFIAAQIIAFYLNGREIDNNLTEDQLLMAIKNIDLNELTISDYRVILNKTSKLVRMYYPNNV